MLQGGGCNQHIVQCPRPASLRPFPLQSASPARDRRCDWITLQAAEKRFGLPLLGWPHPRMDFRDVDGCGRQGMALTDRPRQVFAPSVSMTECIDQNCRIEEQGHFFPLEPALCCRACCSTFDERVRPSCRSLRTQAADPFASSG